MKLSVEFLEQFNREKDIAKRYLYDQVDTINRLYSFVVHDLNNKMSSNEAPPESNSTCPDKDSKSSHQNDDSTIIQSDQLSTISNGDTENVQSTNSESEGNLVKAVSDVDFSTSMPDSILPKVVKTVNQNLIDVPNNDCKDNNDITASSSNLSDEKPQMLQQSKVIKKENIDQISFDVSMQNGIVFKGLKRKFDYQTANNSFAQKRTTKSRNTKRDSSRSSSKSKGSSKATSPSSSEKSFQSLDYYQIGDASFDWTKTVQKSKPLLGKSSR